MRWIGDHLQMIFTSWRRMLWVLTVAKSWHLAIGILLGRCWGDIFTDQVQGIRGWTLFRLSQVLGAKCSRAVFPEGCWWDHTLETVHAQNQLLNDHVKKCSVWLFAATFKIFKSLLLYQLTVLMACDARPRTKIHSFIGTVDAWGQKFKR